MTGYYFSAATPVVAFPLAGSIFLIVLFEPTNPLFSLEIGIIVLLRPAMTFAGTGVCGCCNRQGDVPTVLELQRA